VFCDVPRNTQHRRRFYQQQGDNWRYCKLAKEKGVKVSINHDAHNLDELQYNYISFGIARKGWLEAEDFINTIELREIYEKVTNIER
jgi:histidinol phosphatase-like PHP family hydrolase